MKRVILKYLVVGTWWCLLWAIHPFNSSSGSSKGGSAGRGVQIQSKCNSRPLRERDKLIPTTLGPDSKQRLLSEPKGLGVTDLHRGKMSNKYLKKKGTSIFSSLTYSLHEVLCLSEDDGKHFAEVLSWKKKLIFFSLYDPRPKKKFVTLNVYEGGKSKEQTEPNPLTHY